MELVLVWEKMSIEHLYKCKEAYRLILTDGNRLRFTLATLLNRTRKGWYMYHDTLSYVLPSDVDAPNLKLAKAIVQSKIQQELSSLSALLQATQSITIDALLEPKA